MSGIRRLAAALAAVAVLGACSGSGGSDADAPERPATTDSLGGPTTTQGDGTGASDQADDVEDGVFPGFGDPRIDVESYDVTLRTEEDDPAVTGTAKLRLRPTGDEPLSSFTLDLRGPEVTEATVAGEPAEVAATDEDADEIVVTPAEPLDPSTTVTAEFAYAGEPDQTVFPALGMSIGWQSDGHGGWFTMSEPNGTSTWVPANDHPSDKATWKVTLDTPEGMTGIASGSLEGGEPETKGGRSRWTWVQDEPTAPYLILAAAGDYELETREVAGLDDVTAVFALPSDQAEEQLPKFDVHDEILQYFSEQFGPYPDDDSGAIVVPMALDVAFESQSRSLFGEDAAEGSEVWALPHELAHQWFGNAVTPASWDDLWLNESFATYADWMWRDHAGIDSLEETAVHANEESQTVGLPVHDPTAAATFDPVIYDDGAVALHALRQTVGDEAFFSILRRWVDTYGGGNATTDDFEALAAEESGQDLSDFFDAWIEQAPQPPLPG